MRRHMIYFIALSFLLFMVLNTLDQMIPLVIEEKNYQKFTDTVTKIKKEKVDQIKEYRYSNGVLYQTPSGKIFGTLAYDQQCVELVYPSDTPVIKKKCETPTYHVAWEQVTTTSDKSSLVADTVATGLDVTDPYTSKLYFQGSDPDNYIYTSNACYRVVGMMQNNTLKLVYEGVPKEKNNCEGTMRDNSGSVALLSWDEDKKRSGNFDHASKLKERFARFYREEIIDTVALKIELDMDTIEPGPWAIGKVNQNDTLLQDIQNERSEKTETPLPFGLLNNSDYLKITCKTSSGKSTEQCKDQNYLYKTQYQWWTMNYGEEKNAWLVMPSGKMESKTIGYSNEYRFSGTRLTFYLKVDTLLTGTGKKTDPYRVVK